MRLKRTQEQEAIVRHACDQPTGSQTLIVAGAGTGKTSTLNEIGFEMAMSGGSVLYVVYNRQNKEKAHHILGANANVHTLYSLAFNALNIGKLGRKIGNIYPKSICDVLNIKSNVMGISAYGYAALVKGCLEAFCQSGDKTLKLGHTRGLIGKNGNHELAITLLRHTNALFNHLKPGAKTPYPLPHDVYFKFYQLHGSPGLDEYDMVMLDEAHDISDCGCVAISAAKRLVICGDPHQTIYGFRNATNALDYFEDGDFFTLSQSFRFGDEIAALANAIVKGKRGGEYFKPLKGMASISSSIQRIARDKSATRIYRSNIDLILDAQFLKEQGFSVNLDGSFQDLNQQLIAAQGLQDGDRQKAKTHPLIGQYKNLEELLGADGQIESNVSKILRAYPKKVGQIIDLLDPKKHTAAADITLITAHRAKGHEFKHVLMARDFDRYQDQHQNIDRKEEELNLLYVGVTRCKYELSIESNTLMDIAEHAGLL